MTEKTPITRTQQRVLDFVGGFVQEHGFPPTLGEIGKGCSIENTSSVDYHLKVLEAKGYLRRLGDRHRGLELDDNAFRLPILGRVGAGMGVIAQEEVEGHFGFREFTLGADFLLKVRGDSMEGAGIMEGDMVQVRRQPTAEDGDIVVAMVGQEGVVKRLSKEGRDYVLESENPKYGPISTDFQIVGKVLGLVRRYGK